MTDHDTHSFLHTDAPSVHSHRPLFAAIAAGLLSGGLGIWVFVAGFNGPYSSGIGHAGVSYAAIIPMIVVLLLSFALCIYCYRRRFQLRPAAKLLVAIAAALTLAAGLGVFGLMQRGFSRWKVEPEVSSQALDDYFLLQSTIGTPTRIIGITDLETSNGYLTTNKGYYILLPLAPKPGVTHDEFQAFKKFVEGSVVGKIVRVEIPNSQTIVSVFPVPEPRYAISSIESGGSTPTLVCACDVMVEGHSLTKIYQEFHKE